MSNDYIDLHANNILEGTSKDGFKKHRKSLELVTGSLLIFNIIGAKVTELEILGISLSGAQQKWAAYLTLAIITAYLFFRYVVAVKTYIGSNIKDFIEEQTIELLTKGPLKKIKPKGEYDSSWGWKPQRDDKVVDYGKFYYMPGNMNPLMFANAKTHTFGTMRMFLTSLKARAYLHFKYGATGWDLWMPYYLLILLAASTVYNYLY